MDEIINNLEIDLASNYIASVNQNEPLQEQERKFWEFRNYSINNNGDHELRIEMYQIHTKEFNKQMREMLWK